MLHCTLRMFTWLALCVLVHVVNAKPGGDMYGRTHSQTEHNTCNLQQDTMTRAVTRGLLLREGHYKRPSIEGGTLIPVIFDKGTRYEQRDQVQTKGPGTNKGTRYEQRDQVRTKGPGTNKGTRYEQRDQVRTKGPGTYVKCIHLTATDGRFSPLTVYG